MIHTGLVKAAGQLNVPTTAQAMVGVMTQLMYHSVPTVTKVGLVQSVTLDAMENKSLWTVGTVCARVNAKGLPTTVTQYAVTMAFVTMKRILACVMMALDTTQQDTGENSVKRNNVQVLENLAVGMESVCKENAGALKVGQ